MSSIPIRYHMANVVNGTRLDLHGKGQLDPDAHTSIDITFPPFPPEWNPIIVPCICSGPGSGEKPNGKRGRSGEPLSLFQFAPNGYRTSPGTYRLASLFDDQGRAIASVRATGVYAYGPAGLDFEIDVQTSVQPASPLPLLSRIDHYSFVVLPNGPGKVRVFAQYSLSGPDPSSKIHGCTHIHYDAIDHDGELPEPIYGHNFLHASVTGNVLSYRSRQHTFLVSELGAGSQQ